MSAILSPDDLNDFISPGVACIKPVETLPKQRPDQPNQYEVAKEGQLAENEKAAEISLTDCLACSGCVTSAEAVLVSLQSHAEVLNALDGESKLFVASVSPQVRASLAATYGISQRRAGWMLHQLLAGPQGLATGGKHGNAFRWVLDTNVMREVSLSLGAEEVAKSPKSDIEDAMPKRPVLSSACPGWICYVEKTTPHVLPHLSRLKSPQALAGTLFKTVLSKNLGIRPDQIWHLAVMPCFDKKLEAAREELTDLFWSPLEDTRSRPAVRDVDCVITAREILMLAESRGISFPELPQQPLAQAPFPDPTLASFLFSDTELYLGKHRARRRRGAQSVAAGTSGGYLHHLLQTQLSLHPGSSLTTSRGRNADVIDYTIIAPPSDDPIFKAARYYGFRNITNLVRKLKPVKKSRMPGARSHKATKTGAAVAGGAGLEGYAYVEVMACPGGCTNGGGQIKIDDLPTQSRKPGSQQEWLSMVDEAYFSLESEAGSDLDEEGDLRMMDVGSAEPVDMTGVYDDEVDGISRRYIMEILNHWGSVTNISTETLLYTTYRKVESDVGKVDGGDNQRVVELAGKIGGGW